MKNSLFLTLDLNDFKAGGARRAKFVADLRTAMMDTGFFFLRNHGISSELLDGFRILSKTFFDLPEVRKKKYERIKLKHQVGYTPIGLEKGEFADEPDIKEFFQLGDRKDVPFVHEVKDFTPWLFKIFENFRGTFVELLRAVALSLNLKEEFLVNREGNSIVRAIHYIPTENPNRNDNGPVKGGNIGGMCASQHTDINLLTLLHALTKGLELWYKGEYVPVTIPDPGVIIVNCGDMLEHLTAGEYKSGLHQVVCEPNKDRYSLPFFGHPKEDTSLVPLDQFLLVDAEEKLRKYPYKTAGEYLDVRLKQIGLI